MAQPLLTTVPRVKEYLRANVGANGEEVLHDFITAASERIREFTGRRFTSPRVTETREFRAYGLGEVYVDEVFERADIISVTDKFGFPTPYDVDFGASPVKRGATLRPVSLGMRYGIQGLPGDHADHFIRELRGDAAHYLPDTILVTGRFGYPEGQLPADIKFETMRCVATWWKEEVAHYTADAFISRGRFFPPDELPPIVMAGLRRNWKIDREVAV